MPSITIWIHGTRLTPELLAHNFFFAKPGLHAASTYDAKYHMRKIAHTLATAEESNFDFDHFYIFGWSGNLSFKERKAAAAILYDQIKKLIKKYEKVHGKIPEIRLITHSHGGNVALNLGHLITQEDNFVINQLILLACPVQKKTLKYISQSCFKHIYSIFSDADYLQIADPQGLYSFKKLKKIDLPLFSERVFPEQQNISQAQVTFAKRGLFHVEFMLQHFLSKLPELLARIEKKDISHMHEKYSHVHVLYVD